MIYIIVRADPGLSREEEDKIFKAIDAVLRDTGRNAPEILFE